MNNGVSFTRSWQHLNKNPPIMCSYFGANLAFSLLPVSVALKTSSKRNKSMNLPSSNNVVFVLLWLSGLATLCYFYSLAILLFWLSGYFVLLWLSGYFVLLLLSGYFVILASGYFVLFWLSGYFVLLWLSGYFVILASGYFVLLWLSGYFVILALWLLCATLALARSLLSGALVAPGRGSGQVPRLLALSRSLLGRTSYYYELLVLHGS